MKWAHLIYECNAIIKVGALLEQTVLQRIRRRFSIDLEEGQYPMLWELNVSFTASAQKSNTYDTGSGELVWVRQSIIDVY